MSYLKIDIFIWALRTIRNFRIVYFSSASNNRFKWKNQESVLFSKIEDKYINLLTSANRSLTFLGGESLI